MIYLWLFISSGRFLNNVLVGVKDVAPNPILDTNPTIADFKECGRIEGAVGSAETAVVTCPPGGVIGQHLVLMINSPSDRSQLTVCEITAEGGK